MIGLNLKTGDGQGIQANPLTPDRIRHWIR